jgi:DNA ligase (NAD+)
MDIIKRIKKARVIWEILRELDADELEEALKVASDAYYNSGQSLISDDIYDILSDRLKEINPKADFFKQTGAPVRGKKVRLPYWMGSMNKVKTENDIEKWTKSHPGPYLVMDKLDGISCLATEWGSTLLTRGNGAEGQNVSPLAPMVNMFENEASIVKYSSKFKELAIRGELIMPKEKFTKYSKLMANARNMVAGIVNSKPESINKKHAKDVDFVVYEIIEPGKIVPSEQLDLAHKMGFNVVPNDIYEDIDIEILDSILQRRKKKSIYEIDGLIIMQNKVHPRNQSGNPTYAFAYKGQTETADTTVTEVEWNPSKDGYIIPIIHYKPVRLSGAVLEKTTGFNARYIKQNSIGPGAVIKVVRSGDTIPYVMDIVKPAKSPSFPDMDYTWDKTKVNIILDDASENREVIIKRLTKFVKDIGVENMSEGTMTKLVDGGYDTIPKIMKLKKSDMLKLEGFGETLADKLIMNLDNSLTKLNLLDLMVASNCFGRGFGERKLRKILNIYPDIVDKYRVEKRKLWSQALLELDGFDTISVDKFLDLLPDFQKFYLVIAKIRPIKPYVNIIKKGGFFAGQTIVFTGFRNDKWKEFIEKESGKVTSNVSKNTTLLVYNDGEESSSKYSDAKKLGIKMMTKSKFAQTYNI